MTTGAALIRIMRDFQTLFFALIIFNFNYSNFNPKFVEMLFKMFSLNICVKRIVNYRRIKFNI